MTNSGSLLRNTLVLVSLAWGTVHSSTGVDPLDAVFPADVEVGYLLRLGEQGPAITIPRDEILFDVAESGQPFLFANNTVVPLDHGASWASLDPLTIPTRNAFQSVAIMRDGTFLAVAGKELGVLTKEGFAAALELPEDDMTVSAASEDQAYIYGGRSTSQSQNLYLYRKDGKLLHLFRAPGPIGAVAGFAEVTFVAVGTSIYLLRSGDPLILAYEAEEDVTALAVSPPSGLFYSTRDSVTYVYETSKGFTFLRGKTALPYVGGPNLFLFFPYEGDILKCSPVSSFDGLVTHIRNKGASKD